jgi:diguanylate cyclase (GGDEF)-like protein
VTELLIALAKTAESVGDQTQGQTSQFRELSVRLESIAVLDDLAEIRSSLVRRVSELKDSVDRMNRDNEHLVSRLHAQVTQYETRLREVEHLVLKDELTGVANRRSVEERIQRYIANRQTFCVVMLDLNGFKQINDRHGHLAGDQLLRQFSAELKTITRTGDIVGRWGGDEFVVLLSCDAAGARVHTDRIREWVFGKYTLEKGDRQKSLEVRVEAAMGVAQWHAGDSMERVIAAADAAMYHNKNQLAKA